MKLFAMFIILFCADFCVNVDLLAQTRDSVKTALPDSIYIKEELKKRYGSDAHLPVDVMPMPVGGMEELADKIYYTDEAILKNIEGRVLVQFVVNKDSTVENVTVIKGLGYGLDEIAVDAVKNTVFTPGLVNGKPVEVETTMPVVFKLR
jgi:TonB family protein